MKQERDISGTRILWLDEKNKIISFQKMPGAKGLKFPTREAMLAFALEKCSSGYRIQ